MPWCTGTRVALRRWPMVEERLAQRGDGRPAPGTLPVQIPLHHEAGRVSQCAPRQKTVVEDGSLGAEWPNGNTDDVQIESCRFKPCFTRARAVSVERAQPRVLGENMGEFGSWFTREEGESSAHSPKARGESVVTFAMDK